MRIKDDHKVAILIGTYREVTERQVDFLRNLGFEIKKPSIREPNSIDIYRFKLDADYETIDDEFIKHLSKYDTIVLSGGSTANFVLSKSNFLYIKNEKGILPLVSVGTVFGGKLDGKKVVLKGGLIGKDSCYYEVMKHVGVVDG